MRFLTLTLLVLSPTTLKGVTKCVVLNVWLELNHEKCLRKQEAFNCSRSPKPYQLSCFNISCCKMYTQGRQYKATLGSGCKKRSRYLELCFSFTYLGSAQFISLIFMHCYSIVDINMLNFID